MEPKILPSNIFWGRRSGQSVKLKEGVQQIFRQMQFGCGTSSAFKRFKRNDKSPNVPRKWFNVNYKSKRATTPVAKGTKK